MCARTWSSGTACAPSDYTLIILQPMEELLLDKLTKKCEQLMQNVNVRTRNVIFRLLADVEREFLPLLLGEKDAMSIPYCGRHTAANINAVLDQLRPYYHQLMSMTPEEIEAEREKEKQQGDYYEERENYAIKFNDVDTETEQQLQEIYENMRNEMTQVRARNLIAYHIDHYKDIEPYLNEPSRIGKWHNAGLSSATTILGFFNAFYEEHLTLTNGGKERMRAKMISLHYPFLNDEQRDFVLSFENAEGRLPTLFIVLCYLRQATNRTVQIFARVNGIKGGHNTFQELAAELGLSRERIRQLNQKSLAEESEYPDMWKQERWTQYSAFFNQPLLTETNTGWEELKNREHLDGLDFYGVLALIAQMRKVTIVALLDDGTKANGRRVEAKGWQQPRVLFAYESRYDGFRFEDALGRVGHEAHLQRTNDHHLSLDSLLDSYFDEEPDKDTRQTVSGMLRQILPMFANVMLDGDDIVLLTNRINYTNELYNIISRHGKALTIHQLFDEFKRLHPDDHHTSSNFIRSYMLNDKRFEAVGSKSTYQLSEWKRFAGTLGALAEHILKDYDEPVRVNELCRKMMEQRNNTTPNSCATSIYHAANAGRLQYYIDEQNKDDCVGRTDRTYSQRFWPSPVNVAGALTSLHRFISLYGRWPFASRKEGVEPSLYYIWRKYNKRSHVSDEEYQQFQEGMADIPVDHYPSNEREMAFSKQCGTLTSFFADNNRLPTSAEHPKLLTWYWETYSDRQALEGFRKYRFEKTLAEIKALRKPLPDNTSNQTKKDAGNQLLLDFRDKDGDQLLLDFDNHRH